MLVTDIPPALIMILGGVMMLFVSRRVRDVLTILLPLLTLAQIWKIDSGDVASMHFLAYELITIYVHPYTHIFATVFALAALGGGVFAMHARNRKEMASAYIYAGGAIGVTFSGDLLTLFIFWELMAIASTFVIWSHDTPEARRAGTRYALMHLLGGVVFMAGIAAHVYVTSVTVLPRFQFHPVEWMWTSSVFLSSEIYASFADNLYWQSAGIWLMFIGILVNAAAPPFSAWLSDAYPESSPTGMVFLSAFTTKTAVFVLLSFFAGAELLVYLGMFMVFYSIIMGVLANNIRKILSYSIVNQVGFMLVAIGIGTQLAQQGAAAHAFSHIIYKALLIMAAGSVIYMTGRNTCTELGGLYRTMRLTCICAIIGALSITAFPMTAGFVSKAMIAQSAAYEKLQWVWLGLMAASAGSVVYVGLKFPWFVFFQKDSGLRPDDPPQNMRWAMIGFAALCIIPGVFPQVIYFMLPDDVTYEANTLAHWITQLQLLFFAALAFFFCLPLMKPKNMLVLDFDWIYRCPLRAVLILLEKGLMAGYTTILCAVQHLLRLCVARIARVTAPGGVFAETKPLANTTFIVATLLAAYLLLYYYNT